MRILTLLCIIITIAACSNQQEKNTPLEQEPKMITETSEEKSEDKVEAPVEEEMPTQQITRNTPKRTASKEDEVMFFYSKDGLDALKAILDRVNEVEDGIESFAAFEKSMRDTIQSLLSEVDTSILFTSTRRGLAKKGAFGEYVEQGQEKSFSSGRTKDKSLEFVRKPKPLIEDYSGYKIELMTVYNKSLALTDELFKTFGGLTYRHKTDNSTTYYLGDFEEKSILEDYLNKVVKSRFPDAKGVKFKEGRVVKYK